MESGHHEDSKTSSEENDQQDQVNNDVGTGRSYECIFCKRGFTTAQALGGHMNIHRRDRARIRQPTAPSVSNKPDEEHVSPAFFPPISSHPPLYPPPSETPRNYYMYLPPSTSSTRQPYHGYHADDLHIQKPQPALSLFRDDWRTSLSLQIGSSHVEHSEEEKKRDGGNDELDLELRLGYDP